MKICFDKIGLEWNPEYGVPTPIEIPMSFLIENPNLSPPNIWKKGFMYCNVEEICNAVGGANTFPKRILSTTLVKTLPIFIFLDIHFKGESYNLSSCSWVKARNGYSVPFIETV